MLDKLSLKIAKSIVVKEAIKIDRHIIESAVKNRVLYQLSSINNNTEIKLQGDQWIKKLVDTIKFIKNVLKEHSYLITRTYKYIPYVTFDVDLFVADNDFTRVIDIFEKSGCQILSHDSSLGGRLPDNQKNIIKIGLLTIDLHKNFTWQKRCFLDTEFLIKNKRKKKIADILCTIPSAEAEALLCLSDVTHERFNLTLLDIIWLNGLKDEIKDWQIVFDQTKKYGWEKVFKNISKIINGIALDIYGYEIIPEVGYKKGNFSLPFFLPLSLCWLSYLENFLHNKQFPIISFAYMHYTKLRYYLSGKRRMPYYDDWVKL